MAMDQRETFAWLHAHAYDADGVMWKERAEKAEAIVVRCQCDAERARHAISLDLQWLPRWGGNGVYKPLEPVLVYVYLNDILAVLQRAGLYPLLKEITMNENNRLDDVTGGHGHIKMPEFTEEEKKMFGVSPLALTADELGSLYKAATAAGFRRGLRVIKNERAHRGGKGRDPEPQYQLVLEGTRGTVELTVADVYKKPDAEALARIATQAAFLIESLQSRNKLEDYLVSFLKPFQSGDDEGALNTLGRLVRELEILRGTHKVEPTERGLIIADLRQFLSGEGFDITVPRPLLEKALRFVSKGTSDEAQTVDDPNGLSEPSKPNV